MLSFNLRKENFVKTELYTRYVVKCGKDDYFYMDEYAGDDTLGMAGRVKIQLVEGWQRKEQMIKYLESVIESLKREKS